MYNNDQLVRASESEGFESAFCATIMKTENTYWSHMNLQHVHAVPVVIIAWSSTNLMQGQD